MKVLKWGPVILANRVNIVEYYMLQDESTESGIRSTTNETTMKASIANLRLQHSSRDREWQLSALQLERALSRGAATVSVEILSQHEEKVGYS